MDDVAEGVEECSSGTAAIQLAGDALAEAFSLLDWRSLARCSCVCRAWRRAASAVKASPKQRLRLEFGEEFTGALERAAPSDPPWNNIAKICEETRSFLSHEQHVARWTFASRCFVRTWSLVVRLSTRCRSTELTEAETSRNSTSSKLCEGAPFPPVMCLELPQSVWLRFALPLHPTDASAPFYDLSKDAMELELWANCGVARKVLMLEERNWRVPSNDTDLFLDSHRTGIYAWVGWEAEGDGPLNLGEEAGGMFQRPVVHVAIYVHYEHAFATALRDVPLPQMLSLGHDYHDVEVGLASLQVAVDFCRIRTGCVGGCRLCLRPYLRGFGNSDILDTVTWRLIPDTLEVFQCSDGSDESLRRVIPTIDSDGRLVNAAASPAAEMRSHTTSAPQAWAKALLQLTELATTDACVDFSVYSSQGALLIGRAGVELWETHVKQHGDDELDDASDDQTMDLVPSWRMPFLVDNGLEASRGRNSLWDTWITMTPSTAVATEGVFELSLTNGALRNLWEAAVSRADGTTR
eukprot:CAMPEP_0177781454 /NCGR_PEP_ID=MMETSP0491_2-20121128/17863_1 /TAXON_ID=63592 /ORGANISM="Tetraselmis chuii, Strain PLY429" /LENGTH=522 /DNA_ID=CAMNT_0019301529 /DNA_START=150 /DNA_END=1718 /DNA_ORIENTATION=-